MYICSSLVLYFSVLCCLRCIFCVVLKPLNSLQQILMIFVQIIFGKSLSKNVFSEFWQRVKVHDKFMSYMKLFHFGQWILLCNYMYFVEISTFCGYYPHFVEISTFRGYYLHFVDISALCGYYLHFRDTVRILCLL